MGKAKDLSGMRFGKLTAVEQCGRSSDGRLLWLCVCDCGNKTLVSSSHLLNGNTKSCGCLVTKHGKSKTRLHKIWDNMKGRCANGVDTNYGGKGITICREWKDDFQAFYDWAMANGYEEHLTIDRKNNDKGYSPENCRWATVTEQNNNTRRNHFLTYNGKTQTISQWAKETGINREALYSRINKQKWSIERALTTPRKKRGSTI